MTNSAPTLQQQMAMNSSARLQLLSTGQPNFLRLGPYGPYSSGSLLRQKLQNMGVLRGLLLHVTGTITNTGTGGETVAPSIRAPYNIIQNVSIYDYTGVQRINCSGFQCWMNRTYREGKLHGTYQPGSSVPSSFGLPAYTLPALPTPAAAGTGIVEFLLYVPVCYDRLSDLRGAILMQSITGEMFVQVLFNSSMVGADQDSVYIPSSGGSGTITNINVTIYQDFLGIVPDAQGNVSLPQMDLSTVYELNGTLTTSDNLVSGQEKLLNFPNYRSVQSVEVEFLNAGALAAGNVTQIREIFNGNSYPRTYSEHALAHWIRQHYGFDFPPGVYYISERSNPVRTDLYGNVQIGFTPTSISSGNTKLNVMFESLYLTGTPLSGMTQG